MSSSGRGFHLHSERLTSSTSSPVLRQEQLKTFLSSKQDAASSSRVWHAQQLSASSRSRFLLNREQSLHVAGQNLPIRDSSHWRKSNQEIKEFSRLCRLERNDDCGDIYGLGKICPNAARQPLPSCAFSAATKTCHRPGVGHVGIGRE